MVIINYFTSGRSFYGSRILFALALTFFVVYLLTCLFANSLRAKIAVLPQFEKCLKSLLTLNENAGVSRKITWVLKGIRNDESDKCTKGATRTNGRLNSGSVGKMWADPGKSQKSDCPTLKFVGEDRLIVFSSTWNDGLG